MNKHLMIIRMCRENVKQGLAREIVISGSFVSLKYCGPMCAESCEPVLSPDIGQSSQDHLQSGHVTNASVTISKTNTCHSINFQCSPGAPTLVGDKEAEGSGCDLTDPELGSRWDVIGSGGLAW